MCATYLLQHGLQTLLVPQGVEEEGGGFTAFGEGPVTDRQAAVSHWEEAKSNLGRYKDSAVNRTHRRDNTIGLEI